MANIRGLNDYRTGNPAASRAPLLGSQPNAVPFMRYFSN